MKLKAPLYLAVGLGVLPGSALADEVHGDPYRPVGNLAVSKEYVRTGTKPQLTWYITYPQTTNDFVMVDENGSTTTKTRTRVQMRVVGAASQSSERLLPVKFGTRIADEGWVQLFSGLPTDVQPGTVLFDQVVSAGVTIEFAGRAATSINNGHGNNLDGVDVSNPGEGDGGPTGAVDPSGFFDDETNGWSDTRMTSVVDNTMVALKNGDPVPEIIAAVLVDDIEDYFSSFLNADQSINLGPQDMIYLFELDSREPGDPDFDMQDLVVVVTYSEA
jgi:hypothetical protein